MALGIYQIMVKGQLDNSRAEWFDGWTITRENNGTTLLTGLVTDQSALHGTLTKIRDLNLTIISVNYRE